MTDSVTFLDNIAKALNRPLKTKNDILIKNKRVEVVNNVDGKSVTTTNDVDLVDLFKNTIAMHGGECVYLSKEELPEWLTNFCSKNNVKKASLANDSRLYENKIDVLLDDVGVEVVEWKRLLEDGVGKVKETDIGFTWADGGYSETGTIMQLNKENSGRSVSLLPEIHVAFLKESALNSRLSSAMSVLGELSAKAALPNYINFISGPSSSADIQMQVVLGVHGPRKFCTVILKNE